MACTKGSGSCSAWYRSKMLYVMLFCQLVQKLDHETIGRRYIVSYKIRLDCPSSPGDRGGGGLRSEAKEERRDRLYDCRWGNIAVNVD